MTNRHMGGDESSDEKAVRSKLLLPRVVENKVLDKGFEA
jgi:hypothetical protein